MTDVKAFIEAVNKVEKKFGVNLGIDPANPYELVLLDNTTERVITWLGTSTVAYREDMLIITEEAKGDG